MLNSPIKSPFWMVNSLKNHWIPRSPGQGVKGKGIGGDGFLSHFVKPRGSFSFYPSVFVGDFSCWFHDGLMGFYGDLMMISYWLMEVSMGFLWWFNDGLMGFILIPGDIFGINGGFHGISQASNVPRSRQGAAARPKPSHCAAARSAARWRSPRCLRWKPRCWERFINGPFQWLYPIDIWPIDI